MRKIIFYLASLSLAFLSETDGRATSEAHEKSLFAVVDPVYNATNLVPAPDAKTGAAPWLYGDAELECWRLQVLRAQTSAAQLKISYPGSYYSASTQATFRLAVAAGQPLPYSVSVRAVGNIVVTLGGQGIYSAAASDLPHHIVLPTNSLAMDGTLQVTLTTQSEPPGILIQDGLFATSQAGWQWSTNGTQFASPQVFSQTLSGVPPHQVEPSETVLNPVATNGALFDMGCEMFGRISFASVSGTPALYVGESTAEASNSVSGNFEQSTALRNNGNGTWTSQNALAFRYFRITGVQASNVICLAQFSPAQYRGAFACSDDRLTRIWMDSAYTLRLCRHDFLIDGVKRDRLPWTGDMAMSMMANAYAFGDGEIVRRSLVTLGRAGISQAHINGIVDYSMWWIIAQDYYQKFYQNADHLNREWPRILDALQRLAARCDTNGLYVTNSSDWVFIDWASGNKQTALQILWWWAQSSGALLAQRMGDTTNAAYWQGRADALGQVLYQRAWDATNGGWRGIPDSTSALSRHANIFAVVSGLATASQYPSIKTNLLGTALTAVGTPYVAGFENIALARMGETTNFMARVNSVWGGMLDRGATTFWEAWDATQTGDNAYAFYSRPFAKSLCHAWSSGPATFLPSEIFGLRPVADGWSRFTVNPQLGLLSWACATVPTPHGDIELSAASGNVTLKVPAGTTAVWGERIFTGPGIFDSDSGLAKRSVGGLATASGAGADETADKAFDVLTASDWSSGSSAQSAWLQYQFTNEPAWAITQYKLITSAGSTNSAPRDWQLLGSNDGSSWTTLDTRSGEVFSSTNITRRYAITNTAPFRYYRLNVTATQSGAGSGVRLAEFQLWSADSAATASASADYPVGGQAAASAFDGLTATKWYNSCIAPLGWLQYQFGGGAGWMVTNYSLTSADDAPQRDPKNWQLLGSNDGAAWTTLDTRTGETFASRFLMKLYSCANSAPYRIYRLNISTNSGGSAYGLQLAEFSLSKTSGALEPPANPTIAPGNGQASLSWNAVPAATGYNVKQATMHGGPYTTIVSNIGETNCVAIGLVNGTTYYFVVTAVNAAGESVNSVEVGITPSAPPTVPTGLAATVQDGMATLRWNAVAGATSYNVKRSTINGGPYLVDGAAVISTNYSASGLTNGTAYYFVVSAVNSGLQESANSTQLTVVPTGPPSGLTAIIGNTTVLLRWSSMAGATGYNLKRSTVSGGPFTTVVSLATTNYTDAISVGNMNYDYVVSAIYGGNETANSAEVQISQSLITKLTGTIIGTSGSYNNLGNTIANVFDGNLTTYFDGPNALNGNGCWAGLDLGAGVAKVVTRIKYCPRTSNPDRMIGGIFQGANSADFSSAVTLATVPTQPPTGAFTSVEIGSASAFRYVRYLSPNGGWGNVAEVEFYGYTPVATTSVQLAPTFGGNQIQFAWPADHLGWRLEMQTNALNGGLGTNWFTVFTSTNQMTVPINPANGSVFYRLVYP